MTIEHRRMIVSSLAPVGVSRVISEGIVEQLDSSPAVADAPPRRAQLIGSGISRQRVSWRICPVADEDSALISVSDFENGVELLPLWAAGKRGGGGQRLLRVLNIGS
jgi:hypothetical protein